MTVTTGGRVSKSAPAGSAVSARKDSGSSDIAARLDGAPARRVIAQHGGRLGLLRLLVELRIGGRLGRVQRGRRGRRTGARRRSGRGRLGRLLLGLLALAFLLLAQLRGLQLGELLLTARFFLAQLELPRIDRRGGGRRRGRRRFRRDRRGGHLGRIALHEYALLAHLHLHRSVLPAGVGLAVLARLLARPRDLVLAFG